jgi:hypothetical protein
MVEITHPLQLGEQRDDIFRAIVSHYALARDVLRHQVATVHQVGMPDERVLSLGSKYLLIQPELLRSMFDGGYVFPALVLEGRRNSQLRTAP